ncbi:unnamed protein product [Amoebophrya sp. A120]|nr:unnamed protein product [Amoebophrya sp. A120]|eukprot:GSA120T00026064001.1
MPGNANSGARKKENPTLSTQRWQKWKQEDEEKKAEKQWQEDERASEQTIIGLMRIFVGFLVCFILFLGVSVLLYNLLYNDNKGYHIQTCLCSLEQSKLANGTLTGQKHFSCVCENLQELVLSFTQEGFPFKIVMLNTVSPILPLWYHVSADPDIFAMHNDDEVAEEWDDAGYKANRAKSYQELMATIDR